MSRVPRYQKQQSIQGVGTSSLRGGEISNMIPTSAFTAGAMAHESAADTWGVVRQVNDARLERLNRTLAERAAREAVKFDEQGNVLPIERNPIPGAYADRYNEIVERTYIDALTDQANVEFSRLQSSNPANPEGFLGASESYIDGLVEDVPEDMRGAVRAGLLATARRGANALQEDRFNIQRREQLAVSSRALTRSVQELETFAMSGADPAIVQQMVAETQNRVAMLRDEFGDLVNHESLEAIQDTTARIVAAGDAWREYPLSGMTPERWGSLSEQERQDYEVRTLEYLRSIETPNQRERVESALTQSVDPLDPVEGGEPPASSAPPQSGSLPLPRTVRIDARQGVEVEGLSVEHSFNPDFHYARITPMPFRGIAVHWTGPYDPDAVVNYGNNVDRNRGSGTSAFGYHFVIREDGTVIQAAPMDRRTNHIGGNQNDANETWKPFGNADTMGIALAGQGEPTAEQVAALATLSASMADRFGFDLATSIFGHGETATHRDPQEGAIASSIREQYGGGAVASTVREGAARVQEVMVREYPAGSPDDDGLTYDDRQQVGALIRLQHNLQMQALRAAEPGSGYRTEAQNVALGEAELLVGELTSNSSSLDVDANMAEVRAMLTDPESALHPDDRARIEQSLQVSGPGLRRQAEIDQQRYEGFLAGAPISDPGEAERVMTRIAGGQRAYAEASSLAGVAIGLEQSVENGGDLTASENPVVAMLGRGFIAPALADNMSSVIDMAAQMPEIGRLSNDADYAEAIAPFMALHRMSVIMRGNSTISEGMGEARWAHAVQKIADNGNHSFSSVADFMNRISETTYLGNPGISDEQKYQNISGIVSTTLLRPEGDFSANMASFHSAIGLDETPSDVDVEDAIMGRVIDTLQGAQAMNNNLIGRALSGIGETVLTNRFGVTPEFLRDPDNLQIRDIVWSQSDFGNVMAASVWLGMGPGGNQRIDLQFGREATSYIVDSVLSEAEKSGASAARHMDPNGQADLLLATLRDVVGDSQSDGMFSVSSLTTEPGMNPNQPALVRNPIEHHLSGVYPAAAGMDPFIYWVGDRFLQALSENPDIAADMRDNTNPNTLYDLHSPEALGAIARDVLLPYVFSRGPGQYNFDPSMDTQLRQGSEAYSAVANFIMGTDFPQFWRDMEMTTVYNRDGTYALQATIDGRTEVLIPRLGIGVEGYDPSDWMESEQGQRWWRNLQD